MCGVRDPASDESLLLVGLLVARAQRGHVLVDFSENRRSVASSHGRHDSSRLRARGQAGDTDNGALSPRAVAPSSGCYYYIKRSFQTRVTPKEYSNNRYKKCF